MQAIRRCAVMSAHDCRAEAILERMAQAAMAAEDRTADEETEGAAAVRRLFERRQAAEAEAIPAKDSL